MKIDEAAINHNVVRLVNDAIVEWCENCEAPEAAAEEMTYIRGILELANALKAVLGE